VCYLFILFFKRRTIESSREPSAESNFFLLTKKKTVLVVGRNLAILLFIGTTTVTVVVSASRGKVAHAQTAIPLGARGTVEAKPEPSHTPVKVMATSRVREESVRVTHKLLCCFPLLLLFLFV
jgi:hypothetical protein